MRIPFHGRRARSWALLALFVVPDPAGAGVAYELSPSLVVREEYNSNVTLRSSNPDARFQTAVRPGLGFTAAGKQLRLDGGLAYTARRYSQQGLDSNDWSAQATTQYRQKTQQWSLGAGFTQDSTLQTELLTSGLVQSSLKRFERFAAPSWQAAINDLTTVDVNYRYSIVDYGQGASSVGLFGYRLQQAGASLAYLASPADRISLRSSLLYYRTRDETTKSDDRSLSLGYDHEFSSVTRFGASLGIRQTETSLRQQILVFTGGGFQFVDQVSHNRKNGAVATLDLAHSWRQTSADLAYERAIQQSGGGNLLQNDRLTLSVGYRLQPVLSLQTSLLFSRSRDIGDLVRTTDYDYYQFAPSVYWRVTRDWSLRTYYSYGRQNYTNQSRHAQRQLLGVSVTYSPVTRAGQLW